MRCDHFLFLMLMLAAVSALAADGDTNVLRNGGFEDGQTGGPGTAVRHRRNWK